MSEQTEQRPVDDQVPREDMGEPGARILGDLKVQLNAAGTSWTLLEPLVYHVGSPDSEEIIRVPEGFCTDFASVPAIARVFFSTWRRTARAAVIHDYLYSMEGRRKYGYTRSKADGILREVLKVMGHKRRWLAWAALRLFGWLAWRGNERKGVPVAGTEDDLREATP